MLAICHGPAALIAANLDETNGNFIYDGYEINAFPDEVDKQTPLMGYMPGHMPWKIGEALNHVGIKTLNKKIKGDCHIDRKLISGDSPLAANEFGRLCAKALLAEVNNIA
jgi:molecular chaperone Hsp31 and glyoxalase 3